MPIVAFLGAAVETLGPFIRVYIGKIKSQRKYNTAWEKSQQIYRLLSIL